MCSESGDKPIIITLPYRDLAVYMRSAFGRYALLCIVHAEIDAVFEFACLSG